MFMKTSPGSSVPVEPLLLIGQNRRGQWVVRDQIGSDGVLFCSRRHALRYAMFGRSAIPQAVLMVPGRLELHGPWQTRSVYSEPAAAVAEPPPFHT